MFMMDQISFQERLRLQRHSFVYNDCFQTMNDYTLEVQCPGKFSLLSEVCLNITNTSWFFSIQKKKKKLQGTLKSVNQGDWMKHEETNPSSPAVTLIPWWERWMVLFSPSCSSALTTDPSQPQHFKDQRCHRFIFPFPFWQMHFSFFTLTP